MNRSLWLLGAALFAAGVVVQIEVRRRSVDDAPARVARPGTVPPGTDLTGNVPVETVPASSIPPAARTDGEATTDGSSNDGTPAPGDAPTALSSEELSRQREAALEGERRGLRLEELTRTGSLPADWTSVLDQLDSGTPDAARRLRDLLRSHPGPAVAQQVLRSLERLGGIDAVRALYAIGAEREDLVSEAAVRLSRVRGRECAPALLEVVGDPAAPDELVAAALRSLGHTALRGPVDEIRAIASDVQRPTRVRVAAVEALGWIADPDGLAALLPLLESSERAVRRQAIRSVGRIRDPRSIAALEALVETGATEQERLMAGEALARLRGGPVRRD